MKKNTVEVFWRVNVFFFVFFLFFVSSFDFLFILFLLKHKRIMRMNILMNDHQQNNGTI